MRDFPQGESLHSSCRLLCFHVCMSVPLCVFFMFLSNLGRLVEFALVYVYAPVCLCLCAMAPSISLIGTLDHMNVLFLQR